MTLPVFPNPISFTALKNEFVSSALFFTIRSVDNFGSGILQINSPFFPLNDPSPYSLPAIGSIVYSTSTAGGAFNPSQYGTVTDRWRWYQRAVGPFFPAPTTDYVIVRVSWTGSIPTANQELRTSNFTTSFIRLSQFYAGGGVVNSGITGNPLGGASTLIPSSGTIKLGNFHNVQFSNSTFYFTLSGTRTNVNLRDELIASGWNQNQAVLAVIPAGSYIYSESRTSPALTISGSFPNGITLENNSYIMGKGGDGASFSGDLNTTHNGTSGGPAISLGTNINIANYGFIAGGGGGGAAGYYTGGGGGAGGGNGGNIPVFGNSNITGEATGGRPGAIGQNGSLDLSDNNTQAFGTGGAGGRILPGTGGAGPVPNPVPYPDYLNYPSSYDPTFVSLMTNFGNTLVGQGGGAGGSGGTYVSYQSSFSYRGGAGGSAGSTGQAGFRSDGLSEGAGGGGGGGWGAAGGNATWLYFTPPNSLSTINSNGGAGGSSVITNGYTVNWISVGTRYGSIV